MSKPRDYKAEHARRPIVQTVKLMDPGVSFWGVSNIVALRKLVGKDELKELIDNNKVPHGDLFKLLQIARVDQKVAIQLLKAPESIGPTYTKNRALIAAHRPRRVGAEERIERAWAGYWQRWLEKFDPEDWPFVRQQCAALIEQELEEHKSE
jgi:hypothetical protein